MCQQSVSRNVSQVANAISEHMDEWMRFPVFRSDQEIVKQEFYEYCEFPGVVGAIDCTHVAIAAPADPQYMEKDFLNRKHFHSLNVQIICDMQMEIFAINCRYPGSVHDSHIWRTCSSRQVFESGLLFRGQNAWLLGDSGYPLEPWLMTPIQDATEDSPEMRYNKSHSRGRNIIERCNGMLKSRFRCLLRHRTLHYDPVMAAAIINTCALLHNMCVKEGLALLDSEVDEDDQPFTSGIADPSSPHINRKRDQIIHTYFI